MISSFMVRKAGESILRDKLGELAKLKFLKVDDEKGSWNVIVSDLFMVDTVCSVVPFKHRIALHEYAARWHKKMTAHDIGERMKRFPIIVHHYVMANREDRAGAELMMLNLFGGQFIDKWVLEQVVPMLPATREGERRDDPEDEDLLARCLLALPSIPWLRGLAKAIRGQQIGRVLIRIAVAKR